MIGLKKLTPLFHPIRSKTTTNRDALTHVFPRFASATCSSFFEFLLVHWIACVICDWLERLLKFSLYDMQLKIALKARDFNVISCLFIPSAMQPLKSKL